MFKLESTDFKDCSEISLIHTCEGANASPELLWSGAPDGTQSFALICEDPDAPSQEPWVHWVVYNISTSIKNLPEDFDRTPLLGNGIMQGLNNFEHIGYDGPCPPRDENHRYFFRLFALDALLKVEPGLTKTQLLEAMEGHILGEAVLIGTYELAHEAVY